MPRQSSLLGRNQSLEDVLAEVAADIIQPRPEQTDSSTGLAERSLYEFVKQGWSVLVPDHPYIDGWHIRCIAEHLQALEELEIRNLIINVPPRHTKSLLACVFFFCWAWIRNPSSQWIFGAYGETLAHRDSNRCRDLVQSQWYQARWGHVFRLRRAQNTAERFANDRQGYRIATTVAGKAMGQGGDFLCLPPDEVVWTEQGQLPIGQIVEERLPLRVPAYDTRSGKVEWKPITAWHKNPGSRIVEVVLSDGARVCCTPDHLFWTVNRGWVRADSLLASDSLPRPAMLDEVNHLSADAVLFGDSLKCAGSSKNFADLTIAQLVSVSLLSGARDWQDAGGFAPILAGANHVDGVRRDAEAAGESPGCILTAENGPGFVGGNFRAPAFPDWSRQIAGYICPDSAAPYLQDGALCDTVGGSNVSTQPGFQENSPGVGGGQLGPWPIAFEREGSVFLGILDVLCSGAVFEVAQPSVGADAIFVSAFLTGRNRAEKGQSNALVDRQSEGSLVFSGVEARVVVGPCARAQYALGETVRPSTIDRFNQAALTADSTLVRNAVQSLEARYRSPLFVRHAGYSTKTYCLTVAEHHTMLVGDCQVGIVVKNCWDDAHKPTEVYSDTIRQGVINAWQTTMSTRGNDPKTVRKMIIMQRLHERDLAGYLVAERGGYEHLVLPAEYEPRRYFFPEAQANGQDNGHHHEGQSLVDSKPRDAIVPTILQRTKPHLLDGPMGSGRREEGDLLWPERFGPTEIEALKADLEGVGWAGQGQQRPAPAKGSIFLGEMFRRFTLEPGPRGLMAIMGVSGDEDNESTTEPLRLSVQDMRFYQCADTAMKANAESAYTVIATFAWHRPTRNLLVWHVFRQRLRVHEQLPAIRELRHGQGLWDAAGRRWLIPGKLAPWPRHLAFQAVEDKASGHGILDEARASGYPLRPLKTGGQDKVMRAAVAATMYGAGKVWHRAGVNWLTDLEDELLVFPSGAYADQVDVISYACRLADEDSLLNAAIEGPLLMPSPMNEDGLPATPDDLRRPQGQEVFHVGGTRVVFQDENDSDGWQR